MSNYSDYVWYPDMYVYRYLTLICAHNKTNCLDKIFNQR